MNYRYYQEAIRQAGLGLVLISAAAGVLAFVWAERTAPDWQVHFSYLVSLSEREAVDNFRFDGYYALSATDLFAATLSSWVKTPEVIAAAYKQAGLTIPSNEPDVLRKAVEANKTGPQLVEVTVRHKNQEAAAQLTAALQTVMADNVARYHEDGIPALKFTAIPTESWAGVHRVAAGVIAVATFMVVLFGGINIVLLKASLEAEEPPN